MRRREFIKAIVSSALAAWPFAARAQQPAIPVIGFLNVASADGWQPMVTAFRRGLQENGYVEGQNVAIEYRWADGRTDRLPGLVAEFVHHKVTVIAATSTPAISKTIGMAVVSAFAASTAPVTLPLG